MSNPARFWACLVGSFAVVFGTVDILCARGPANGDTFSECLAEKLDSPAKRSLFVMGCWYLADWFPRHIMKDRT